MKISNLVDFESYLEAHNEQIQALPPEEFKKCIDAIVSVTGSLTGYQLMDSVKTFATKMFLKGACSYEAVQLQDATKAGFEVTIKQGMDVMNELI